MEKNKKTENSELKFIKREKLSENVARQLLELISRGILKPGEKIPTEKELIGKVGVSRTAVREGMQRLLILGIIEIRPGQGTFVSQNKKISNLMLNLLSLDEEIKKSTLIELLEFRKIIEIGMVDIVVKRGTDKDLIELKECLEKHKVDIERDANPSDNDINFHRLLVKSTNNKVLLNFLEGISELIRGAALLTGNSKENRIMALKFHEKIYRAIEERNSQLAMEEMGEHINYLIDIANKRREF